MILEIKKIILMLYIGFCDVFWCEIIIDFDGKCMIVENFCKNKVLGLKKRYIYWYIV